MSPVSRMSLDIRMNLGIRMSLVGRMNPAPRTSPVIPATRAVRMFQLETMGGCGCTEGWPSCLRAAWLFFCF